MAEQMSLSDLAELLAGGSDDERARLEARMLALITEPLYAKIKQRIVDDAEALITPRILVDGQDITAVADGTDIWYDGGEGRVRILDIIGATGRWHDRRERDWLEILIGSGLFCYDFIVSSCWAAKVADGTGRFSEGQVFDLVTGCTVRVFSTLAGAATQANTDADHRVIFICPGRYVETSVVSFTQNTKRITIHAAGRERVIVVGSVGTDATMVSANLRFEAKDFSLVGASATRDCFRWDRLSGGTPMFRNMNFGHPSEVASRNGYQTASTNRSEMDHCRFENLTAGINGDPVLLQQFIATVRDCTFVPSGAGSAGITGSMRIGSFVSGCYFQGGEYGIYLNRGSDESHIAGCSFNNITIDGIHFEPGQGAGIDGISIAACRFLACADGIDLAKGLVGAITADVSIVGCTFSAGTVGIRGDGGNQDNVLISSNLFTGYACGNEMLNVWSTGFFGNIPMVVHNQTDSGCPIRESTGTPGGAANIIFDNGGLSIGWDAFESRFDQIVALVPAGTLVLTDNARNFVELRDDFTVVATTTYFTLGRIPLAEVVTAAADITSLTNRSAMLEEWRPWQRILPLSNNVFATDVEGQPLAIDAAKKGADIPSAVTLLFGVDGDYFHVTGSTGITAITSPAANYSAEILAKTPAGYWRMSEASGLIQDSSGNAQHATTSAGTAEYQRPGLVYNDANRSIRFSGDDRFGVPDSATLSFVDTWTLEAWVRRGSLAIPDAQGYTIFDKGTNGPILRVNPSHQVEFGIENVSIVARSSVTIEDTDRHHIVVTKAGATRAVYIDGEDVTVLLTNATGVDNTNDLRIGHRQTSNSNFWNGHLDELAVYVGTALSAGQVAQNYRAGNRFASGFRLTLEFDGVCLLTHSASLILQGAANYTTAPGDVLAFVYEGSGNWRETNRHTAATAISAKINETYISFGAIPGVPYAA